MKKDSFELTGLPDGQHWASIQSLRHIQCVIFPTWIFHMTTDTIISRVWSFRTTLRDDGVGYGDYLEQLI